MPHSTSRAAGNTVNQKKPLAVNTAFTITKSTHAMAIQLALIARTMAQRRWSRHTTSTKQRKSALSVVVLTMSQRTGYTFLSATSGYTTVFV